MNETQKKSKLPLIAFILTLISWGALFFMIPIGMISTALGSKDNRIISNICIFSWYGLSFLGLILSLISKGKSPLKSASFIMGAIPVGIMIVVILMVFFKAF